MDFKAEKDALSRIEGIFSPASNDSTELFLASQGATNVVVLVIMIDSSNMGWCRRRI